MSWDLFTAWKGEADDIADATAYGAGLLLQNAPEGPDVLQFLRDSAPLVLTTYAGVSQDAAKGYVDASLRAAGLSPSAYQPGSAVVTWPMIEPVAKWALEDVAMPWTVEDVLPRFAQGTMRIVSNTGRDTVTGAVRRVGGNAASRRVPSAGACAWCRLLSIVSHTKDVPDSAYHGHCRCKPILSVDGDGYDVPAAVEALWAEYEDQALDARRWAVREQRRIDRGLWDQVKDAPYSLNTRSRMRGALRRQHLPTIQQLTLSRMREQHGIR